MLCTWEKRATNLRRPDVVKILGDSFSGTTACGNNAVVWLVGFMNLGEGIEGEG